MFSQNKRLFYMLLAVILLLLIPLVAMQFTKEINWSIIDFGVAGILLFGVSLIIESVLRKVKNRKNRFFICVIILILLLLLWIELAVGIFGSIISGN